MLRIITFGLQVKPRFAARKVRKRWHKTRRARMVVQGGVVSDIAVIVRILRPREPIAV
jgi:hypothetical protein